MIALSPIAVALEGVAVMRREPKAVIGWIAVWLLALIVIGALKAATGTPVSLARGGHGGFSLTQGFGPLTVLLIPTLLVLWIMTTATVFRAVIRPHEHGWHLFKLGPDEARLGIITAIGCGLVVIFGSGPALILLVLIKPVLAVVPALGRWIVIPGTIATVCLEFLIAVRLSLIAVHTFAEGRFHVIGYWRLTRGYFWRLLGGYLIVFVQIGAFLVMVGLVALLFGWAAMSVGSPHGVDLGRRALLLGLAAVAALLSAIVFVVPLIIISAAQAYAFRAIAADPLPVEKASRPA
ncbi:MAG TPA: hypothetical protein VII73_09240 [Caulobacteraceae bacterium]